MKREYSIFIQAILLLTILLISIYNLEIEPIGISSHLKEKDPLEQLETLTGKIINENEKAENPSRESMSTLHKFKDMASDYSIQIDGNADFHARASIEQWPGDGTSENPYLIDGYNVSNSVRYWISIQNTNIYFQIRNCNIYASQRGIRLENVQNGQILNNTIWWICQWGILLYNSTNNIIKNNSITHWWEHSCIGFFYSDNNHLTNNILNSIAIGGLYGRGLIIEDSEYCTVVNNTFVGEGHRSEISNSPNNNFINNSLIKISLILSQSANSTIINNTFTGSYLGIDGSDPKDYIHKEVRNNTIDGRPLIYWRNISSSVVPKDAAQVFLINCEFIEISGLISVMIVGVSSKNLNINNNINSTGISLLYTPNNILTNNTIFNSWIEISHSRNNTLIGNNLYPIWNLAACGIQIYESEKCVIINNTFLNGVSIINSNYTSLINNTVVGVSLKNSNNNKLNNNTVFMDPGPRIPTGITLDESGNNTINNNILHAIPLIISGDELKDCLQAEVRNNSVDWEPLIYMQNISDKVISNGTTHLILVNCKSIKITGQKLKSIQLIFCSDLDINDNEFIYSDYPRFCLDFSTNNIISNNTFNHMGMRFLFSDNNTLISNNFNYTNNEDIILIWSKENTLIGNTLRGGTLNLESSDYNLIKENDIRNGKGVYIGITRFRYEFAELSIGELLYIYDEYGIYINDEIGSRNNRLENNVISENDGQGISIYRSYHNVLDGNNITNHPSNGIDLDFCGNTTIDDNTITDNAYGIEIRGESYDTQVKNNDFCRNNLGNNQNQASDNGLTSIFVFNYWDDWTTPDANGDGIVDHPYSIDGEVQNFDYYPRVDSVALTPHLLAPPIIILPKGGEVRSGSDLLISWTPVIDSEEHSISYSVFYSVDNATTWVLIVSQLTGTDYSWDPSVIDPGTSFLIKVVVTCSEGLSAFDVIDDPLYIPSTNQSNFPYEVIIILSIIIPSIILILVLGLKLIKKSEVKGLKNL